MAAYRDREGVLHRMSAVCPHLKGMLTWNGSEGSWDCPHHASRFDSRGHVVNGPAIGDLQRLDSMGRAKDEQGIAKDRWTGRAELVPVGRGLGVQETPEAGAGHHGTWGLPGGPGAVSLSGPACTR